MAVLDNAVDGHDADFGEPFAVTTRCNLVRLVAGATYRASKFGRSTRAISMTSRM